MKNKLISNIITLMFIKKGVKDNIDLIRCNILAMEIERNNHTIESIKKTSAYLGCNYDIPMSGEFLQSLLDKKQELIELLTKSMKECEEYELFNHQSGEYHNLNEWIKENL